MSSDKPLVPDTAVPATAVNIFDPPSLKRLTREQRHSIAAMMELVVHASQGAKDWASYWAQTFIDSIKRINNE